MNASRRLDEILNTRHVKYQVLRHPLAFSAQQVARRSGVSGRNLAKVVALRDRDGDWLLAVVPAPLRVDLPALEFVSHRVGLRLATETELAQRFPSVELGAMIPLRQIHGIPVFLDDTFLECRELFFEDGTHNRLIGMRLPQYLGLAQPFIGHFGVMPSGH